MKTESFVAVASFLPGRAKDLSAPLYRDADKFLAGLGRKQATATEDFDVHISYL